MSKSGILLVKKIKGISSYDVIRVLKKRLHTNKIGHAGTLDPFASGLLIIGVNEGTKILSYLENETKEYIAELTLGKLTDTYDITGKVIKTKKPSKHTYEEIDKALSSFNGEIMQTPPIFSALKLNGKPLYKYARENKSVDLKERKQIIYKTRIVDVKGNKIMFYVKCNKGTYIRSLGVDLASKLGEIGYLSNLERIGIGKHYILNVKKPECLSIDNIIPITEALSLKKVNYDDVNKIKNGVAIKLDMKDDLILLTHHNTPLAIYEYNPVDKMYHSRRGFNYESI